MKGTNISLFKKNTHHFIDTIFKVSLIVVAAIPMWLDAIAAVVSWMIAVWSYSYFCFFERFKVSNRIRMKIKWIIRCVEQQPYLLFIWKVCFVMNICLQRFPRPLILLVNLM